MPTDDPSHISSQLAQAYEALQKRNDEHQRDLEAARRVQLQLLPQETELPQREEIEFVGYYQSKDRVGGDLYDFIRIGMNSWGFLVADVSGHGVPSALLTMFLKAAFRTRVRWGVASDQVCREVNSVLNPVVRDLGLFVTAFFGILDLETGRLRYSHCGHPPVYLHRFRDSSLVRLEERGMILGPFEEVEIEEDEILLEEGDTLLSVTDGLLESRNFREEMFGDQRLAESFVRHASAVGTPRPPVGRTLDGIRRDWELFSLGTTLDDDVTMAALRYLRQVPAKGDAVRSDVQENRARKDRILAQGLRRNAKEAYGRREFAEAATFLDALLCLEGAFPSDLLLRALVARKLGSRDQAQDHAKRAIEGLTPGSTREKLARKILDSWK